ncbi:MAG: homoserine dehydrogenase [Verrucomicrobiae bacterium]|nr:homoserine dehydrogenase [Verrucomicrobiae bacterium]
MKSLRIGLVGIGTVGQGVYKNLQNNADLIADRVGVRLDITRVADKFWDRKRVVDVPEKNRCTDACQLTRDPNIDVVIELVGGTTFAGDIILDALKHKKPVVTANKALLAHRGEELFAAAAKYHTNIFYEASVAGGIPIIKALREGLIANRIQSIHGIINGTCNYILSRMAAEGANFDDVLKDAQAKGYAEAEASLDVDGFDTAHKTVILASLAYGFWVDMDKIHIEGIRSVTAADMQYADKLGYVIKLLAVIKADGGKAVEVRVHPTLVPKTHLLASVSGVFNAVFVRGDIVGDTAYYGRGAGMDPTSSAVISDLADVALNFKFNAHRRVPPFVAHKMYGKLKSMDDVVSRYYLRLDVVDRPGVLAQIATILGKSNIGIMSVIQPEGHEGQKVPLILMIHDAKDSAMRAALTKIDKLDSVRGKSVMFRVESFE